VIALGIALGTGAATAPRVGSVASATSVDALAHPK
jgi:hypothetical protein